MRRTGGEAELVNTFPYAETTHFRRISETDKDILDDTFDGCSAG